MGWGALASAVISAYSANRASSASKKAAKVQANAADAASAESRRQFDLTRGDLAPWLSAGTNALNSQQNFLGLNGVDAQSQAYEDYQESSGQQFLRERGQKSLLAGASAIGGLGGGNVRSALQQQGIGFAAQNFGNYYNRLAGLSNTGQQTGVQLGQFGANSANEIGANTRYAGEARASGILGSQQAISQGLNNIAGIAGRYYGGR